MAAIRFFDPADTEFMKPVDVYPDSLKERLTAAEVADTSVRLHQGLPGKLQLFEIRLEPGPRDQHPRPRRRRDRRGGGR